MPLEEGGPEARFQFPLPVYGAYHLERKQAITNIPAET